MITFEFPRYTTIIPKEYELFLAFSDDAVALYTGHFYAPLERPAGDGIGWCRKLDVRGQCGRDGQ